MSANIHSGWSQTMKPQYQLISTVTPLFVLRSAKRQMTAAAAAGDRTYIAFNQQDNAQRSLCVWRARRSV
jgi:hypothetical protein